MTSFTATFFFKKKCLYYFLNRSEDSGNKLFETEKLVAVECASHSLRVQAWILAASNNCHYMKRKRVSFVQVYVHLIMTDFLNLFYFIFYLYTYDMVFQYVFSLLYMAKYCYIISKYGKC